MSRTKTLWVREPYLGDILAGLKTVEVRVGYDNIRRLQPGDRLRLNDAHPAAIRRVGRYADFEEMLAHESAEAIAPGLPPGELLAELRAIYPPDKEALGAIALELELGSAGDDPTRRYDAILMDMGYTLVYFEPPQPLVVQAALRAAGAERTLDEIAAAVEATWGGYYRDAATATFPATEDYDRGSQLGLSRALLGALAVEGDEAMLAYHRALDDAFGRPDAVRPYAEVHEVLARLGEQGYRLGIVSNWSWNLIKRVTQAGLDGYMELVWASAYAGCNKPHPAIFRQALERLGVPAGRALYVGDSYEHDIVGARGAGLQAVLVDRSGATTKRDCPVIADLWELFDLL